MRTLLRRLRHNSAQDAIQRIERCLEAVESYLSAIEYGEGLDRLVVLRQEAIQRLEELNDGHGDFMVTSQMKP